MKEWYIFIDIQIPGIESLPNQCGIKISGFTLQDFGNWDFLIQTSRKEDIKRPRVIESIKVPCNAEGGEADSEGLGTNFGDYSHDSSMEADTDYDYSYSLEADEDYR